MQLGVPQNVQRLVGSASVETARVPWPSRAAGGAVQSIRADFEEVHSCRRKYPLQSGEKGLSPTVGGTGQQSFRFNLGRRIRRQRSRPDTTCAASHVLRKAAYDVASKGSEYHDGEKVAYLVDMAARPWSHTDQDGDLSPITT